MAVIFIRTIILYIVIHLAMRIMGKRQLGELEISEFIVASLIADLASTPLQDIGIPLLNGLIPIIVMFCLEVLLAGVSMKSPRLRAIIYGKPEMLICNGVIDSAAMRRNRLTLDELMQELRAQGQLDARQIAFGVLEANGQLSVILKPDSQPAPASASGIAVQPADYPHIIINDGRIMRENLKKLGRNEKWLSNELKSRSLESAGDVYFMTLSDSGQVQCCKKGRK